MKPLPIAAVAFLSVSCLAVKKPESSPVLDSPALSVRIGEGNPAGIYRYDFATGDLAQVVQVDPAPELIKYAFTRAGDQTEIYLVSDGPSGKNLYRATVPTDGSVTATPTRILGNDDLNGPAICGGGENLVVGQFQPNGVQVLRVPLPAATGPTVAFSRPDFLAGDLHCRASIDGFFFAGFECPPGGTLGKCLLESDSVTTIYHIVNGAAVPVTSPSVDLAITSIPRPKRHHKGDVDPTASPLSDGRIVLGFSRVFNSPLLAETDVTEGTRENGYHKLMLSALAAGATQPADESEVDVPALFRELWQLPADKTLDFVMSTVDVRESAAATPSAEFIVAASVAPRGEHDEKRKFSGLVYGKVPLSELGKPKASVSEMRGLLTMVQLSCGIWRAKGLGDSDGKVYVYGAFFPRFVEKGSSVIHFSTIRGAVGSYLPENGGAIRLQDGQVVPADGFMQAFCS